MTTVARAGAASSAALSAADKKKKNLSLKVELAHIEKQIYDLETTYLEDTQQFGNIFVGWSKYFLHQHAAGKKSGGEVAPDERLFSLSSASSPASLLKRQAQRSSKRAEASPQSSSDSAPASKRPKRGT
mmetsp:Transcript_20392/g.37867  ORF Transcript_20392/g.37867 Transcript_20392/m.37867 type:complete len:129 (+) Transcript_20392:68-454(+)